MFHSLTNDVQGKSRRTLVGHHWRPCTEYLPRDRHQRGTINERNKMNTVVTANAESTTRRSNVESEMGKVGRASACVASAGGAWARVVSAVRCGGV